MTELLSGNDHQCTTRVYDFDLLEGRFMNMMSACNMPPLVLLLLVLLLPTGHASVIVGCPVFRYILNGTCYKCPDNCRVCVSDTNCSLCEKGFYGPVCENRCAEGGTGTCHKFFGHCTYGCPDTEYPAEGNGCRLCPLHCSVCESQSKCTLCEDGHFGEGCQERCSEHCTRCNKTTGQCLQCKDSYFRLNGQCKNCPQGCRLCGSINTCTQCKESYFKHDELCKSCPHGCIFCNTTDNCQSCADGFHGPVDGRCLYKCPSNGVITYNVPYEDGRCGIWQDTDSNICHLQSEGHSCTSSGNCIQAIRCPYTVQCMDKQYGQTSCATMMQYECTHKCKRLLSIYGCETTCTVYASGNTHNNPLCMADTGFINLRTFENTAKADCRQEQGCMFNLSLLGEQNVSGNRHDCTTMKYGIAIAVIASFVILIVIILRLYRKRRFHQQKAERRDEMILSSDLVHELSAHVGDTNLGHSCAATSTKDRGYHGSKATLPETCRLLKTKGGRRRRSIS